ncbi:MAG: prolyl oligopeptidase family serine peptidase [Ktedonobacterales bacterium]
MPRPITSEDLYSIKLAEDPQISPNGTQVAYVLMEIDRETYQYHRSIWMEPTAGGPPSSFTSGRQDSRPRWSPDGSYLAFLRAPTPGTRPTSEAELALGVGKPQIYVISASGGEARQLTFMRHGAGTPVWSPDGSTILFAAPTGEAEDPEVELAALQDRTLPRVHTITEMTYRFDGKGFIYDLRSHLFTIPLSGGAPRQLTDGDWNDGGAAWSPDGRRIAFTADRSDQRWQWPADAVWLLDLSSGSCERLTDETLGCASPTWSPDGKMIAYLASPRRHGNGHTDLHTIAAQPGSNKRQHTADFVATCQDTCMDDCRTAHSDAHLVWSSDGEIYFLGSLRGDTHVYALQPEAALPPRTVSAGNCRVYGFSLDASGGVMALGISTPAIPGDLYVAPARGGKPTSSLGAEANRLTAINAPMLEEIELAVPREFSFHGADGWELQGWVMRPAQAGPTEPLPTILQIHGGPTGMYGNSFFHEFQLLAAQGYEIVYSNPRGSTGYGRDFSGAVQLDWGGKDYEDILAGLDAAIAEEAIDSSRLGVAGGSYGGYMTNWIVGHTDRFKAAVTMRSVVNFASFFGTSDIGWQLAVDDVGATPWENLEELMKHSPVTYVADIHTPLLILHSENDLRCPISEAEQLFISLKYLDRETKFIRFEGQTHDLSRNGHPRSRVIRLNEIVGWFNQYLRL